MPEKAAQVITFTAFIWLEEENRLDQHQGFLRRIGKLPVIPSFVLLQRTSLSVAGFSHCWERAPSFTCPWVSCCLEGCLSTLACCSMSEFSSRLPLQAAIDETRESGKRRGSCDIHAPTPHPFPPVPLQEAFWQTCCHSRGSDPARTSCSSSSPCLSSLGCWWIPAVPHSLT